MSCDRKRVGRTDGQTDGGLLCVYTYTQMSLLFYLIWACNNVYALWVRSAFACLVLEIGKQGCHSDGSIWFWSLKREKTEYLMESQERKCYHIDILNLICDIMTCFNQEDSHIFIFSSRCFRIIIWIQKINIGHVRG